MLSQTAEYALRAVIAIARARGEAVGAAALAKQAGMGEDSTGFVYANVKDALPLLQLAGVKLPAGVSGVSTFFAYGDAATNESTFTAFLGVG